MIIVAILVSRSRVCNLLDLLVCLFLKGHSILISSWVHGVVYLDMLPDRVWSYVLMLFSISFLKQTKEDEDECGRHKKCYQCRSQQKLLMQECQPFQEEVAATSFQISPLGQCTVLEYSESAGPSESMAPVKQELMGHWSASNKVAEQSRGTIHSSLMIEKESKTQDKFNHCVAVSLHLAKKEHRVIMPSNLCNGVDPNSPSSQKMKRRKPFVKLIPGQSVPRFRYPSKTALCNLSHPQVVWVVNSSEQDVCA